MSADNGIYILKTPCNGGFEYRVEHCMAIENICYDDANGDAETVLQYFGKAPVFTNEDQAILYAHQLAKQEPILEYGVSEIELPHPFAYYRLVAFGPSPLPVSQHVR